MISPSQLFRLLAVATMVFIGGCNSTPEPGKPQTISGELEVARQFLAAGEYAKAITTLQAARHVNPKSTEVEGYLGMAFMGLGDFRAAIDALKKAVDFDDKNNSARLNLAYAYIVTKKTAKAREVLDEIISDGNFPYMEKTYINYGLSYLEDNRCDLAVPKFDEALRLDPTSVTAHFNSGKCQMRQRKYQAAIASFQKARDFCPGCVDPVWELARAYHASGQRKAATESLESLLRNRLDRVSEVKTREMLREFKR